ncbi:MAG: DUF523 domain-containing protein [Clostridia bacterium]|nr:DUF523 domain-containing protein [Clostridia bacterium]
MYVAVSACLLGLSCRYDGKSKTNNDLIKKLKNVSVLPVCPEIMGGLKTPRKPCEIYNKRVISVDGTDCTANYKKGAEEVLKLCNMFDCRHAILKANSPSCGNRYIYDGTFSGKLTVGEGITAELLRKNGIKVLNEKENIEEVL